jgi:peptidoglycan/LPS O-acetylase OafA/YrhL
VTVSAVREHLPPTGVDRPGVRAEPVAPSRGAERNRALDFTKGALVLVMVVYHWINYFLVLDWDIYRYIRFVTPSFIFIAGFLISSVYLTRYASNDPRLRRRLLERGAKLLLLFTVLNVAAGAVLKDGPAGAANRSLGDHVYAVYVVGSGAAVFEVLVPIAYFLMLSPALLAAARRSPLALPAITSAALLVSTVMSFAGVASANVELISIALLGMVIGTIPTHRLVAACRRPLWMAAAYVVYVVAITLWNIVFPLQVAGVCLTLLIIYFAGLRWGGDGPAQRVLVELGNYSLFSYIAQVVILQVLRRGLRGVDLTGAAVIVPFVLSVVLLIVAVKLVALGRRQVPAVDRLYKLVFA